MVLDMALCISAGNPIRERKTSRNAVLYLALEDLQQRIQSRLWAMGEKDSKNIEELYIATKAEMIGRGLEEQLTVFYVNIPMSDW